MPCIVDFAPVKKYKPKRIKMHVVIGHIANKMIIKDFDIATPGKKIGVVQSVMEKTRAAFRCKQLQVWNIRLE